MDLIISIALGVLIAWVAIKFLKVVLWVVGVIIVANLLSSALGLLATIIIIAIFLFTKRKITNGMLLFICIAFLLSLI